MPCSSSSLRCEHAPFLPVQGETYAIEHAMQRGLVMCVQTLNDVRSRALSGSRKGLGLSAQGQPSDAAAGFAPGARCSRAKVR